MRFNRKRHKLLKSLAEKISKIKESKIAIPGNEAGFTYTEIESLLGISRMERYKMLSELFEAKEIMPFRLDNGSSGCFINSKEGITALSNKKYLIRNEKIILDWIKNFVQIVIPVLSLIITLAVIKNDNSKKSKEIQTIENKVESLQENIKSMELKIKTLPNRKKNDSLLTKSKG
tara:strand:- start:782 stop:1306 length:525 start_codon:yes stop_codon:yes gene_type:complete